MNKTIHLFLRVISSRPLRGLRDLFLLLFLTATTAHASPPNIVFILADDLGWRDLACTGSTFYETPNLDRLAKEGTRFTTAYAACPVCSPTRAAIMTGLYPPRTGITDYLGGYSVGKLLPAPYPDHLPTDLKTLPQSLKAAGYVTWHLGKWHLGGQGFWPENYGFDVNVGGFGAGHPSSYFSPYKNPKLPDGPKGEFLSDRLTTEAVDLIKHRDPGKPFFLNFWHYAVHTPIQAPQPLIDKYTKKAHDLGLDTQPAITLGAFYPFNRKANERVKHRHLQSDPAYAALVENMDTNIGRLLRAIDDAGIADHTLVIFTSDNGGLSTTERCPTSNDPLLEGKGWLYEGGTRVAMIARLPGVTPPGSTCATPVISTDFLPTFLDIAALPAPARTDGLSLLPLFKDPAAPFPARPLFWHYPHYGNQGDTPGSSMRAGDWKLIERFEDHSLELYNLKDDPGESHDLAKSHPDQTQKLHAQLDAWRQSVGAKIPVPNLDYEKQMARVKRRPPAPASAQPDNN